MVAELKQPELSRLVSISGQVRVDSEWWRDKANLMVVVPLMYPSSTIILFIGAFDLGLGARLRARSLRHLGIPRKDLAYNVFERDEGKHPGFSGL